MKTLHNLIAACLLTVVSATNIRAQDAASLVKEGVQLHDQKKYPEAIEKYQQALKIDPNNMAAEFEWSFSLFSSGKGIDAIPHLEKVIKNSDNFLAAQACDILGSIYDDNKQPEKAMEVYQKGITLNPKYQRLRYNIALALLKQNKAAEAEAAAIEAIKLQPRHPSSHQVYAVALQSQGKDVMALMAYCNFLTLEPQSQRALADNQQIQNFINARYKATGEKSASLTIHENKDTDIGALEAGWGLAIADAESKKDKKPVEKLEAQLTTLFKIAGELSAKRQNKDFFWNFYVDFLAKLANSEHMPAFAHLITVSLYQADDYEWLKANPDALKKLSEWINANPRQF